VVRLSYSHEGELVAVHNEREEFVRISRTRVGPILFEDSASDDAGTLDPIASLLQDMPVKDSELVLATRYVSKLRRECDARGGLPYGRRAEIGRIVQGIEAPLAGSEVG